MDKITINHELLISRAIKARERAYAAYSKYKVGAAVLTEDGHIFTGCNIENAVYPLTLCAERVAIFKAVSEGTRQIVAIAVATANGGTPCGSCRQVMREFGKPSMRVYITDVQGNYHETTLEKLLPDSFSVKDLSAE